MEWLACMVGQLNFTIRRKIQATSTYIYETLFKGGSGTDITISALGQRLCVCTFVTIINRQRMAVAQDISLSGNIN